MKHEEVSDEMLMALADGELRGAEERRLRQLIAQDSELADRYALFSETRLLLREAYPSESVPEHLIRAVLDAPTEGNHATETNVVPLRQRSVPAGFGWGMALAASLVVAVGVGGFLAGKGVAPGPMAQDPINAAAVELARQVTGGTVEMPDGRTARVLASFETDLGLCRLIGVDSTRAVVCSSDAGWTTALSVAERDGSAYLPASDVATGVIDAMLDAIGAGAPLDPEAERAALDR